MSFKFRVVFAVVALAGVGPSLYFGCSKEPNPAPMFIISADTATPTSASTAPYNYGEVDILTQSEHNFAITNNGDQAGHLNKISAEGLKLSEPYEFSAAAADSLPACETGMQLAPGASCAITVTFVPAEEGSFTDTIEVFYTAEAYVEPQPANAKILKTSLGVLAKGLLNCALDGALADSRANGVTAADEQMVQDAIRGKREGDALTLPEGDADGYRDGHAQGYRRGYDGPEGYDKGYRAAFTTGRNRGLTDGPSCTRGASDGYDSGVSDGRTTGRADGYDDGYDEGFVRGDSIGSLEGFDVGYIEGRTEGYAEGASSAYDQGYASGYNSGEDLGYDEGYDFGYYDGADSCSFAAASDKAKAVDPADYIDSCYQQGYSATYSTQPYWDAYNKAKRENENYQLGYRQGETRGLADGETKGIADGLRDGRANGDRDGFAEGSGIRYQECFYANYPDGYDDGYTVGYEAGFDDGYDEGFDDGYSLAFSLAYEDGFAVGYDDGYFSNHNGEYNDGYDAGESAGYDDGYWIGYDQGYSDGEFEYCSFSTAIAGESTLQKKTPRSSKVPSTEALAKAKAKTEKMKAARSVARALTTPVSSKPPKGMSLFFDDAQVDAFKNIRSEKDALSLRSFLTDRESTFRGKVRLETAPAQPKKLQLSAKDPMWKSIKRAKELRLQKRKSR